jgi:uncharacterized protein involved in exopolysaccharide biosynthesis
MEMLTFVRMILARWQIVLAGSLLVGVLLTAFSLVKPPNYAATAQVLVEVRTPDTIPVGEGQVAPAEQLSSDYVSTQVDVLRSDRVALAAVDILGLTTNPEALAQFRQAGGMGSPAKFFADVIRKHMKFTPSPGSRVISVTANALTPQDASQLANAFVNAYRRVTLDLQVDPARQASAWYDERAKDLLDQLNDAQAKLAAERLRLGVAADAEVTDAEAQRWNALSAQIAAAQSAQSVANVRTSGGALPDALASPVVQRIQGDLAAAEAQRRALSATAGPNNPDYIQISRQVEELKRQLDEQEKVIAHGVATAAAQSDQSVGRLTANLKAEKSRVIASNAARNSLNGLQQQVDSLKLIYNTVVAKRAQSSLLGSGNQTNVSVLAYAVPPTHASGIPTIILSLAGLIFGAVLGAACALAMEFFDQRIRGPSDAEAWLRIPNLGQIRTVRSASSSIRLLPRFQRQLPRQAGFNR